MRTVSYEVYQGDQHVTVIPGSSPPPMVPGLASYFENRNHSVKQHSIPELIQQLRRQTICPDRDSIYQIQPFPSFQSRIEELEEDRDSVPPSLIASPYDEHSNPFEIQGRGRSRSAPAFQDYRPTRERRSSPHPHPRKRNPHPCLRRHTESATIGPCLTGSLVSYDSSRQLSSSGELPLTPTTPLLLAENDFSSTYRTASRMGVFYFAYGTNMNPSLLASRLPHSRNSSRPIAIAKLRDHSWFISSRGVANIAPIPHPTTRCKKLSDTDTVWGILYNVSDEDEAELDMHTGWSQFKPGVKPNPSTDAKVRRLIRPWSQGECSFNKLFLSVEIEDWFTNPEQFGLRDNIYPGDHVRAMVYIDEHNPCTSHRVSSATLSPTGPICRMREGFASRMDEAATAAHDYGVPRRWIETVMGRYGVRINDRVGMVTGFAEEDEVYGDLVRKVGRGKYIDDRGRDIHRDSHHRDRVIEVERVRLRSDFY